MVTETRHLWQRPAFVGATGRDGFDAEYESWSQFLGDSTAAQGEHPDRNILYGWNWLKPGYGYRDDEAYDGGTECLETFWILPFKNVLMTLDVVVTPADEDAVREWLEGRGSWLADQWRPVVVLPNPEHRLPTGDTG